MRVRSLLMALLLWAVAVIVMPGIRGDVWTMPLVHAASSIDDEDGNLDRDLSAVLSAAGFTGTAQQGFERRIRATLGRPVDPRLADLGRLLWFDKIHSLRHDNTCGGCHSPTNGFGDSQPMAIGVQNNNLVGPHRAGPRNQRRSPLVVNTAIYPALMWNGRFSSRSGDPFDNAFGFTFPFPDDTRFSYASNVQHHLTHLLQAQAHVPPTELIEVAGFTGTCPTLGLEFCQFDDGVGEAVPPPDGAGSRNEPIREDALALLNASSAYRKLFGQLFPEVGRGAPIDFFMFGKAIAEFEFTLVFADAPVDRFARGQMNAMTAAEKRGALLFFRKARCVECHAVSGPSEVGYPNEMFSDFTERVIGVPQIAPYFGTGLGNVMFDGPNHDEDFGLGQVTGDKADRYKFRVAPLRNLAVAPGFFHNGAFITMDDALRFHLNVVDGARRYDPVAAGVPPDLVLRVGALIPKELLDPLVQQPIELTPREFGDLVSFVRDALLDPRVRPQNLCKLVPARVPSGMPLLEFEACKPRELERPSGRDGRHGAASGQIQLHTLPSTPDPPQ
jgi:cytochrome c peroxidase